MDTQTTSDSPSALLERAAELIEKRASEARQPPWRIHDFAGEPIVLSKPSITDAKTWRTVVPDGTDPCDVAWIAMLGTQVAHSLVEWLRETVEQYRTEHSRRTVPAEALDEAWTRHPAVRFARQVLGES